MAKYGLVELVMISFGGYHDLVSRESEMNERRMSDDNIFNRFDRSGAGQYSFVHDLTRKKIVYSRGCKIKIEK